MFLDFEAVKVAINPADLAIPRKMAMSPWARLTSFWCWAMSNTDRKTQHSNSMQSIPFVKCSNETIQFLAISGNAPEGFISFDMPFRQRKVKRGSFLLASSFALGCVMPMWLTDPCRWWHQVAVCRITSCSTPSWSAIDVWETRWQWFVGGTCWVHINMNGCWKQWFSYYATWMNLFLCWTMFTYVHPLEMIRICLLMFDEPLHSAETLT